MCCEDREGPWLSTSVPTFLENRKSRCIATTCHRRICHFVAKPEWVCRPPGRCRRDDFRMLGCCGRAFQWFSPVTPTDVERRPKAGCLNFLCFRAKTIRFFLFFQRNESWADQMSHYSYRSFFLPKTPGSLACIHPFEGY